MKYLFLFCIVYLSVNLNSFAQEYNKSPLTIKQIMQGDDFIGHLPSSVNWSQDGSVIYFDWNPAAAMSDSLYAYNLKTSNTKKVAYEIEKELPSRNFNLNQSKTKKVYAKYGDIFIADLIGNTTFQITSTKDFESNPYFVKNETEIAFTRSGDIFTWNINTGGTKQVTNFTDKKDKEDKKNARDEWLKNDQLALFGVLRERKAKNDERKRILDQRKEKTPLEIYTDGKSIFNQKLSPTGDYATYIASKRAKNNGTIMPNYVTESGYTENESTRSKVGDDATSYELFVYDIKNKKVYPVVLDNLEGKDYIPEYTKEYPDKTYKNDDRIGFISGPLWNDVGTKAVLDINTNDYKDRWIVLLDAEKGTITNLDQQHDEAWIAGPGIGGYAGGDMGWMPDDKSIWFQSEKTGYSHLYTIDVNSKKVKALTAGNFEIYDPFLSKDEKRWYFTANKNHPGDRQFYTMALNGDKLQQLTAMIGNNEVSLSPDEKSMAILYSYSNKPTELFLQANPIFSKNTAVKQITNSITKEFKNYDWRAPEIITFNADDNAEVYARLYQPKTDIKNKGAIIFVHGAGYLQNAHQWWSSYFREYMFHNFLVDNGYTVLDIDYRGSAGYGRDWRTGIYRHMGGKDLSDHVDGAEYLVSNYGIDKDKIGIYGGSYGGFITLMGMFNEPETFKAGAAIRSVGDWAAYNHGYTARILNTPVTDSLAYRRSSPIYFADGLKGDLLILHGMIDDNVHFQDMVRLSQRLIELEKPNWEMTLYPMERHGFEEASSWTDEYNRIYKLFQQSLMEIKPEE